MSEKNQEPENEASDASKKAKHHFRMRHDWNNLIDDLIQDGQNQGMFDNLPGKGKPLNLKKNIYGADQALAHGLMKHNEIVPAWIMDRNHILEQIDALRAEIKRTWQR
ncbi:MAG: DUF1992 domain-containing protein, partial [Anaerolineales bacterium]|nr:DUF1992 domain-containing protein [Anaerolineales bacterium]